MIAPDKWKHFWVGVVLGLFIYAFFNYFFHFRTATAIVLSLGIVASVSYIFELFSLVTGEGHYELMDAIASILGGLVGIFSIMVVLHFV